MKVTAIARQAGREDLSLLVLSLAYWFTWAVSARINVCQPDCVGYYSYLQSLLIDGDLALANEFAGWGMSPAFTSVTPLGHVNDVFACGAAILWFPFVAAVHAVLLLARACGADVVAKGFEAPYLQAISFATAGYGYLALVLGYRLARRITTPHVAAWATVATATLTSAWQYILFDGLLSHALSAFTNALFLYLAVPLLGAGTSQETQKPKSAWAVLGLSGGLVTLVRWQDVILPAVIGAWLLWNATRQARLGKRSLARSQDTPDAASIIFFLGGCIVAFLPQLLIWQMQHGTPVAIPQGASFFHPLNPQAVYVLLSSHHGLFVWTPLVVLSMIGWILLLRSEPRFAVIAIVTFVLHTYVNSIVLDPAAGVSFGSRRFTSLTVFNVVGLAALLAKIPCFSRLALTTFAALWTFPLWIAFHLQIIDQVRFVSFANLASAVAQVLTMAPKLLHTLGLRFLENVDAPLAPTMLRYSLAFGGTVVTVIVARRLVTSQSRPTPRTSLAPWAFTAVFIDGAVALAAMRSAPLPIRVVQSGHAAHIDFGAYANSRFDRNPFDPSQHFVTSFQLPSEVRWGDVPFRFLTPPADQQTTPSTLTTCGLPLDSFNLPLEAAETRALHLALGAAGAGESGMPVLSLLVDTLTDEQISRTLHADAEVWDLFKTPPPEAVVYDEIISITGFSLRFDPPLHPRSLTIMSPFSTAPIWPCAAIYAVTQELVPNTSTDRPIYRSVSLAPVANADHSRNAFHPATRHNFFPHLQPGIIDVEGTSFLILDRHQTPSGQSTLTNAMQAGFKVRLPLAPMPSTQLALLLSAWTPDGIPGEVAEVEVQYDKGPSTRRAVVAERDVLIYRTNSDSEAALRPFFLPLDPSRVPQSLWIRRPTGPQDDAAGIAIFALSQQLPEPATSPGEATPR